MRRLVVFSLAAVICWLFLAGFPAAGAAEADQEGSRAAAIRRLETLAASRAAGPGGLTAAGCEVFTAAGVAAALELAEDSKGRYGELAASTVASLDFVANNLRQTAQDASAAERVRSKLAGLETDFAAAAWAYAAALEDLAALGEDCAGRPALFAAGLLQARSRQSEVIRHAEAILRFVENDFADALADARERAEDR